MKPLSLALILVALLGMTVLGCANKTSGVPLGTVQVRLTDAPGTVEAVHLVITGVSVHRGDDHQVEAGDDTTEVEAEDDSSDVEVGEDTTHVDDHDSGEHDDGDWENVSGDTMTVDLMALRNGVFTTLGITPVPAGRYTQIRLRIGAGSTVTVDGATHPLVVPSGMQSGLKLVHPFTVPPSGFVDLLLDFDAQHSLVLTGAGTWLLKPTIKITTGSGRTVSRPPARSQRTM